MTDIAGLTYTQSGTGAQASTLQNRMENSIHVEEFVQIGDTSDDQSIQRALDASSGREVFCKGGKTYICNNELTLSDNTRFRVNGATLDFSGCTGGNKKCLQINGTGRSSTLNSTLTANGTTGAYSITVTDGTKFAAGNFVQITAEDSYIYDGLTSVKRGEIKQIQSVSSNTVTFTTALLDTYTTANTAKLWVVNFSENIEITGLRLIGTNIEADSMQGIYSSWGRNILIENVNIKDVDLVLINFINTIDSSIKKADLDGVRFTGTGSRGYGFEATNCTQNISFSDLKSNELRHVAVWSSSTGDYGQPLYLRGDNLMMTNSMAGDSNASYAYEHHGFGRFIQLTNIEADGCYSGLDIEGSDLLVDGATFRNLRLYGVEFQDGRNIANISLNNIRVSYPTDDGGTSSRYGLYFEADANGIRENIHINGLYIDNFTRGATTTARGVYWGAGKSGSCRDLTLSNVRIFSPTEADSNDMGIRIDESGVVLDNITIHNYPFALFIGGNNCDLSNIIVKNDATPSYSADAIRLDGNNNNLNFPIGRNLSTFLKTSGNDNTIGLPLVDTYTTFLNNTGTGNLVNRPNVQGCVIAQDGTAKQTVDGQTAEFQILGIDDNSAGGVHGRWSNDNFGGVFMFAKSRGATVGSHAALHTNDGIFSVQFNGDDGTNLIAAAKFKAFADGTIATGKVPGKFLIQTADANGTLTDRLATDSKANIVLGSAAIATTATDGFLYIPTCAGTPTGTPTSFTGRVPIVYDTTNNKLCVYNGAWKKTAALT